MHRGDDGTRKSRRRPHRGLASRVCPTAGRTQGGMTDDGMTYAGFGLPATDFGPVTARTCLFASAGALPAGSCQARSPKPESPVPHTVLRSSLPGEHIASWRPWPEPQTHRGGSSRWPARVCREGHRVSHPRHARHAGRRSAPAGALPTCAARSARYSREPYGRPLLGRARDRPRGLRGVAVPRGVRGCEPQRHASQGARRAGRIRGQRVRVRIAGDLRGAARAARPGAARRPAAACSTRGSPHRPPPGSCRWPASA